MTERRICLLRGKNYSSLSPDLPLNGIPYSGTSVASLLQNDKRERIVLTKNEELKELLTNSKTIAVVGASPKPWRDSGGIASFLMRKGYKVFPVNPKYEEVLGTKCYPDLKSIPDKIDIVDIFRNPDEVEPVIDEAIAIGAKSVWMQLGVVNEAAAAKAEKAGLKVVMDRCIAVEHRALLR